MGKLNEIIAVEKGVKARVYAELSDLHKVIQKPDLFSGFTKEYRPKNEDGEKLPPESKRVQFNVAEILSVVSRNHVDFFNITARKDWTNATATSDIVVDEKIVLSDVPVTYLLFLEKQLTDLRTMFSTLPVLDEGEEWTADSNSGLFKTKVFETQRTKKVQKALVLYHATAEHPAQTQIITEDEIAGFWATSKASGAIPKPRKALLVERVEKLLRATKEARERANGKEETGGSKVGETIFGFLLAVPAKE